MQLIFVYNAESGNINALLDGLHKVLSSETYNCNLCAITYGTFAEKKEWREFRENSDHQMTFLHRDEFETQYASKWLPKYDYPIILISNYESLEIFITTEELNGLNSSKELISLIESRLSRY